MHDRSDGASFDKRCQVFKILSIFVKTTLTPITTTMRQHVLTLCMAAALGLSAATPRLDIYRDEQPTDTVRSSKYYLIAVTDPGSKAWIDGKECHVYKTGSFGAELTLRQGENMVPVKVQSGKKTATRDVRLVYVPRERRSGGNIEATRVIEPLTIATTEGAYLQNGNGDDRLGGSKMGFLSAGIPLLAVGETDNLYQVKLGDNRRAYLPKEYATAGDITPMTVNTSSATIDNMGRFDRFVLSLPARLPYTYSTGIDPSTIKVTLYGATNNSNWITQHGELGMVDYVDFEQTDTDVLTLVFRLKEKYQWGFTVGYNDSSNSLTVDIRHCPASLDVKDLVIGLDAGHGGEYPGARSPSGLTEKEVNLDIVLHAARLLRDMGAKVVLTREGDTGPSMTERKRIWREGGVDIAISVHNNASGNPLEPMGTSTYYKHLCNRPLAKALHDSMIELGLADFGLTGNFNFSLNGPTDYPNALVEALFMSSLPEEELLADPQYRRQVAAQVVKGLLDYLKEVERSRK